MPSGTPGSSTYVADRVIGSATPTLPLVAPGPTTIYAWSNANNAHAGRGTILRVENTGLNVIDVVEVRGSYRDDGSYYSSVQYGPIAVGQGLDCPIPAGLNGLPPPYIYAQAENVADSQCVVRLVNGVE